MLFRKKEIAGGNHGVGRGRWTAANKMATRRIRDCFKGGLDNVLLMGRG